MNLLESLGNIFDVIRHATSEDFDVIREGRQFKVHVRGRVHSFDDLWVYDVTATDVGSMISETISHVHQKEMGIEQAIHVVMKILKEKGLLHETGGRFKSGYISPACLPITEVAHNCMNERESRPAQVMDVLVKKGFIPGKSSSHEGDPASQPQEEQFLKREKQREPVPPQTLNMSETSLRQLKARELECQETIKSKIIEPDLDGLYTSTATVPATPNPEQLNPETTYITWQSTYKGIACIINNHEFPHLVDNRGNVKMRRGSEIDLQNVQHLFRELGYEPLLYQNLTREEILSTIDKTVLRINAEGDRHSSACFIFMSHGNQEGICGTDASDMDQRIVSREEIKERLSGRRCKGLLGKPKLLFIQACRGGEFTRNADELDAGNSGASPLEAAPFDTDFIPKMSPPPSLSLNLNSDSNPDQFDVDGGAELPNNSDIFVANATSNGYFSIRMRRDGSWFIQALSEVFLAHAHLDDLNELMRKVTCLVTETFRTRWSAERGRRPFEVRQTPAYESQGMRKRFFFYPKYASSDQ